jgi:hypothetical protein
MVPEDISDALTIVKTSGKGSPRISSAISPQDVECTQPFCGRLSRGTPGGGAVAVQEDNGGDLRDGVE